MKYKTLYCDPPWMEAGGGKIKRGADRHYLLMATKDICKMPVHKLIDDNCHLYLWVTNNFFEDGAENEIKAPVAESPQPSRELF